MDAIADFTQNHDAAVLAIQAGNDLIISSDFPTQYQAVLDAVYDGTLTETEIDEHVRRVLDWKHALGLITYEDDADASLDDQGTTDSQVDTDLEDAA